MAPPERRSAARAALRRVAGLLPRVARRLRVELLASLDLARPAPVLPEAPRAVLDP